MKSKDTIIASGGWVPRQGRRRPRTRQMCWIAASLLIPVGVAVIWLCRIDGVPTLTEHLVLLRCGDIVAWLVILIDTVFWIYSGILSVREPQEDFEELARNPSPDPRKLY